MKVICEQSLWNFQFWSGAVCRAEQLTAEEFDIVEDYLESSGENWTEVDINDLFWFEFAFIVQDILGLPYDADADEILR